ncbi:tetratricopeptide repeat protein [Vagococcus xieshaowenii]|uniref:Tetratricopeptide repeat protein n=1 Tax=Vagococcus xieshaowenii TaxID=2562451 RepID=A0AAJ5JM38_9ENTE|nr:tetratricopeptide repeat protein [Vagococcus xieshaowenii]QCA28706.1 tetratricopeptide repeat protein [Vagococcus xieshaowenii]TFZ40486.1 tetratricopeptide repeat protein [Vagococcus xieshaowenii]
MTTYSEQMLAAIQENDYVEAELLLEKALKFDDHELLGVLGDELFRMGFIDEAKKIFIFLLDTNKVETSTYISLAEIAIEEDKIDDALEYLSKVSKEDELYPASLLVAADLYFTIQIPETAEAKLKEALQLMPNEPTILFALAELSLETDQFAKAVNYYKQLSNLGIEDFAQTRIPKQLATALSHMGEFDEAVELFEKELKENRSDDVLHSLALLYIQTGENEKAIALLEEIRLLGSTYLNVYVPLVSALIDENRLEEADAMIKAGLKENPYDVSLYHLGSDFAYKYHRLDEAEEYLINALKIEEDKELTLIKLSNLYIAQEEFEEVVALLEDQQDLMNVQGHWSLAQAYYGLEQYEDANIQYHRAYEGLDDEPDFLREYGLFLREEGNLAEAQVVLEQYLEYFPDDMEIQHLLVE